MRKEYLEYLKVHDPIHYSEMMGDPVTGLPANSSSGCTSVLIIIGLIGVGLVIGMLIK